jgi:hypothetical protein
MSSNKHGKLHRIIKEKYIGVSNCRKRLEVAARGRNTQRHPGWQGGADVSVLWM